MLSLHLGAEEVRSGHGMMPDVYCNLCVQGAAALCGPSRNHGLCRKCSHGRTSKQATWSLMEKMVLGNFDFKLNSEKKIEFRAFLTKYKKSNLMCSLFTLHGGVFT